LDDNLNPALKAPQLGLRIVGRPVIDDDDFGISVGLFENVVDSPTNKIRPVEGRDDHAD
jgi:hypothetical protein